MTRKEAIINLNALKFILDNDQYTDEIEEALDMAISALQQSDHIADGDKKDDHLREVTKKVDMISRQAILNKIEKIRQSVQMMDDTHRADIVMSGINLCEKAVRNQPPAQPEQRWIPVGERLPAYGEDVLISIGGYCTVGYIVSVNGIEQYNWFFSGWYHLPDDVDAWMPLPEPYRKEGEADG